MKEEENSEIEFLKELSPLLFEKGIGMDAEAPDGYFEEFGEKIKAKIHQEEAQESRPEIRISKYINVRNLAIAGSVALILALVPFFRSNNVPGTQTSELVINPETEIAELNEYIDESDLYTVFENEEISDYTVSANLTDDEIINYLVREDYSEQLLLEMR